MKAIFIFILLQVSYLLVSGQNSYYWYQSEKVYLKQNHSVSYFNVKSLEPTDKIELIQQIKSKFPTTNIINMSSDEFVIEKGELNKIKLLTTKRVYQSFLYETEKSNQLSFSPPLQ